MTFESMISGEAFLINLGIHIRQMRERKDLSQQNLADMCKKPRTSIGRIERADVSVAIKTLIKIANALKIQPKDILDFKMK